MAMFPQYSVLKRVSDPARDETLNIGLIVLTEEKISVWLDPAASLKVCRAFYTGKSLDFLYEVDDSIHKMARRIGAITTIETAYERIRMDCPHCYRITPFKAFVGGEQGIDALLKSLIYRI